MAKQCGCGRIVGSGGPYMPITLLSLNSNIHKFAKTPRYIHPIMHPKSLS